MKEISYNPLTGLFTWSYGRRGVKAGSVAGSLTRDGYLQIKINHRVYSAHRLAMFLANGKWPIGEVDHIDGNRLNNALANLRDVSRSVNSQNQRKAQSDNKSSGLLGVTWNKQHKKWQSKIMVNKVYHHVGLFDCSEVAHAAYIEKKRQLHVGCTI